MTGPTLGVVFRPQSPPERLREAVVAADRAGVAEFWLWEDCFLEGGLTTAAAALAWSDRITVGVGLLPVPLRNPALAAMEIATLARLFPDRFAVALGHGVLPWMAQVGAAAASPMTLLREYTVAVRDLLAGHTVDAAGSAVTLNTVTLDRPPQRIPTLLVGARGPRTVRLAGEVADGVLLDAVAGPAEVRTAATVVAEGRAAAGRDGTGRLVVYTELDTEAPGLAPRVADRAAALGEAGADTVIFQATDTHPDPAPLIAALAVRVRGR
jgi:alkanesulfonate monooxygenase SsuD/methylene tetrahydromethanopterin reductase-like flavin-dependent oxidoreductase (luciferase family)